MTRTTRLGATAATAPPTATTASPPMMVARRRGPSPIRPITGALTAPENGVTVNDHCATVSDVWKCWEMVGTSDAPSELMMLTTKVVITRTGPNKVFPSVGRHWCSSWRISFGWLCSSAAFVRVVFPLPSRHDRAGSPRCGTRKLVRLHGETGY
jgi:hypothetical protein